MKRAVAAACLALAAGRGLAAEVRPWQRITVPTVHEAARLFASPPPEYGVTLWWWWNGSMTEPEITRDLEEIRAHGVRSVLLWAYYGLSVEYLSRSWFERVRFAIGEARRLDMRVWLMDEGSYPSGFAGGKISREHPELRMQALAAGPPVAVAPGGRISLPVPDDAVAVVATDPAGRPSLLDAPAGTTLEWSAGAEGATVTIVRREFRTNPTRLVNRQDFPKDTTYRKEFRVPGRPPRAAALDLGRVLYAARVQLNARDLGARAWRPFRWDLGGALRPGLNVLEVEVGNTGANELAAAPERYREIESKGWLKNSYVRRYLPFDEEMVPSGLLGPVRILSLRDVR